MGNVTYCALFLWGLTRPEGQGLKQVRFKKSSKYIYFAFTQLTSPTGKFMHAQNKKFGLPKILKKLENPPKNVNPIPAGGGSI